MHSIYFNEWSFGSLNLYLKRRCINSEGGFKTHSVIDVRVLFLAFVFTFYICILTLFSLSFLYLIHFGVFVHKRPKVFADVEAIFERLPR